MAASSEIDLLTEQLKSPDRMVRMRALVMLVNKGDQSIEPILTKLAAKDESTEIRYYAKKALNMLAQRAKAAVTPPVPEPGQTPHRVATVDLAGAPPDAAMLRRMMAAADVRYKVNAARLALEGDLKELAGDFAAKLVVETDPVAIASFVVAVGKLGGPAHSAKLVKFLDHADARVRANTVDALEATGDGAVYPYLIRCLRDDDNRCRANAARALRAYGAVKQMTTLKLMLESDDVWMQDSAAYVLGFIADASVFGLFRIALQSHHRVVREQARSSLQRLKEKGVERAGDILARIGGERKGRPEEELFQRLSRVTADMPPATPVAVPIVEAEPPPSVAPEPPPSARIEPVEAPAPVEFAPAIAPEPALPVHAEPVEQPPAPAPVPIVERPESSPFYRPAPKVQIKRKSAEDALASLSALASEHAGDIDFIAKEALREEALFEKLRSASDETVVNRQDATPTASARASRALESLSKAAAFADEEKMPADRETEREERIRARLEHDLENVRSASTAAEAMRDKLDRENDVFARLSALAEV